MHVQTNENKFSDLSTKQKVHGNINIYVYWMSIPIQYIAGFRMSLCSIGMSPKDETNASKSSAMPSDTGHGHLS